MEVAHIGNGRVLKLMERVDSKTCTEVESALQALIATNARYVVCDFSATKYISSAGLRVLLMAAKALKRTGGRLGLVCAPGNYIYEVFDLTAFTQLLPVFRTVNEAAAGISQAPDTDGVSQNGTSRESGLPAC